jgi:alkanesulfonate monooxygenase SsuD/methylene tetrahydromethanopterin reductase-like flavin-dependent oxidoreductase (luciferase family)
MTTDFARRSLEFAIIDHFERQDGVTLERQYAERYELVAQAEQYGFTGYHVTEHHLTPLDIAPSPIVYLAALAQHTSRIRIGSMVLCLPLYHPVRVIQEICMLDHISGGRFELGVGRGVRDVEHEWFGHNPMEARSRFAETLEVVLQGITQGRLDFHGRYYQFDNVTLGWETAQKPMPPLWYAGTLSNAADRGMNGLSLPAPLDVYEDFWRRWDEKRAAGSPFHQREPKVGSVRWVLVADSDDAAQAIARRAWRRYQDHFFATNTRVEGRALPWTKASDDVDAAIARGQLLVGSPETVRGALEQFLDSAGPLHTYLVGAFHWGDLTHDEAMRSLRLYATEVKPALAERRAGIAV